MGEYKVELNRIGKDDVRKILEARIERFVEPFSGLEPVRERIHQDTLFPLSRNWLEEQLSEGVEFRPRDALIWARDAWEDLQERINDIGGDAWLKVWPKVVGDPGPVGEVTEEQILAAIDEKVGRKIQEHIDQRKLQPGSLPPDAGNLAALVEALLGQCQGEGLPYTFHRVERMKKKGGKLPPYDLLVRERRESDGREITTGVSFVTNTGKSATDSLKRLLMCDPPPDHRMLVTDHERRKLTVGNQGVEYLNDLKKLGEEKFQYVKLTFNQYAALDALEGAVTLGRVGDIEVEIPRGTIRPVSEPQVVASHHRQDRYRSHPLLRPLLTEEEEPVTTKKSDTTALDDQDVRQHIMAQLAWRLGMSAFEVTNGYIKAHQALKLNAEDAIPLVKEIATQMHQEGLIYATPSENDLFLQRRM